MHNKFVKLQDISPIQRQLTGLPFGIYDYEHNLLDKLHLDINARHREHAEKQTVLDAIKDRHLLISQNRYSLSQAYMRDVGEIGVEHALTRLLIVNGKRLQFLMSDIFFQIADGPVRYNQLPLCFGVDEDLKTWLETIPLDATLFESSGLRRAIRDAIFEAKRPPPATRGRVRKRKVAA